MVKGRGKSSEWVRRVAVPALILATISCAAGAVGAQKLSVAIRVIPGSPGRLAIEGGGVTVSTWSFRDSYAGMLGLGARIENFSLFDAQGANIAVRKLAPGQFESTRAASKFRYEVNLAVPPRSSDSALVSWLNTERGILMLGDLLPAFDSSAVASAGKRSQNAEPIIIQMDIPAGWSAYSSEDRTGQNEFEVTDSDRAILVVGRSLRASARTISGKPFMLITDGRWAFADSDAMDTVARIVELHSQVVGSLPCKQPSLFLLTFPHEVQADKWSAQTRGCAVFLLMGKNPSRTAALAQLGNALTHELFHLWIPNGLELAGDYDWFHEGFTLYQAARSAVRLDLVTFPEFLNAISRAYDGYLAAADRDRWSLIEASKRRWTVGASSVYSKAMVIAFLYDLNLRFQSKGKHSLDDVYRRFIRERATSAGQDGNAAAISALQLESFGAAFVQRFIVDPVAIDLPKELAQFGLGVEQIGLRTRIYARNNLTRRQRDLLRQLGYNERSR
jgi:hypothetical protein